LSALLSKADTIESRVSSNLIFTKILLGSRSLCEVQKCSFVDLDYRFCLAANRNGPPIPPLRPYTDVIDELCIQCDGTKAVHLIHTKRLAAI
jgi:hypothetical protein